MKLLNRTEKLFIPKKLFSKLLNTSKLLIKQTNKTVSSRNRSGKMSYTVSKIFMRLIGWFKKTERGFGSLDDSPSVISLFFVLISIVIITT